MRKKTATERLESFEREFRAVLPDSFDTLYHYLEKRYGQRHLPVYRSPGNRHVLAAMFVTMSGASHLGKRVDDAVKAKEHSWLLASLAAPFDHVAMGFEAHLIGFYRELDALSDEQFLQLLTYLEYSDLKLEIDRLQWWLHHELLRFASIVLAVASGGLLFVQGILGVQLIGGEFLIPWRDGPTVVPLFEFVLVSLLLVLTVLTIRRLGLVGFVVWIFVILALPLYGLWKLLLYGIRTPFNVAFEAYFAEDYRQKGWLGSTWLPIFTVCLNLVACGVVLRARHPALVISGGVILALTYAGLIIWFYHWNFHPLFFFDRGARANVYLRLLGIERSKDVVGKLSFSSAQLASIRERLSKALVFCRQLEKVIRTNRLDILTANSFVLMFVVLFGVTIFEFYALYRGLHVLDPGLFVDAEGVAVSKEALVHLSLNNLPVGGSSRVSGSTAWMEVLLFSQRMVVMLLLVLAVFAYSTFSSLQLKVEKERLRRFLRSQRADIRRALRAYDHLDANAEDRTAGEESEE
ncbi:MAG TPA: hypothetical protein VNJ70_06640 [Thermoanaerobaculia bacterium]|nr:hypothetical protein [Thermoanaerobaculia bacterium]